MKLTLPQIHMINHAASVNYQRMEARRKARQAAESAQPTKDDPDPIVMNGKRLSELSTEEFSVYFMNGTQE